MLLYISLIVNKSHTKAECPPSVSSCQLCEHANKLLIGRPKGYDDNMDVDYIYTSTYFCTVMWLNIINGLQDARRLRSERARKVHKSAGAVKFEYLDSAQNQECVSPSLHSFPMLSLALPPPPKANSFLLNT